MTNSIDIFTKSQCAAFLATKGVTLTKAEIKRTSIADLRKRVESLSPVLSTIPAKRDFKPFRDGTKQAALFRLMSRKNGATLDELCEATGWQPSSVKSAFYLDMRKMHGVGIRETAGRFHAIVPK